MLQQQSLLYQQGIGAPTVTDIVNKLFELPEGCEDMLLGSVKNWNDSKGAAPFLLTRCSQFWLQMWLTSWLLLTFWSHF